MGHGVKDGIKDGIILIKQLVDLISVVEN